MTTTEDLIERLPDVLWSARLDGTLVFVSGNARRVLGYDPRTIVDRQRGGVDLIHPDDQPRVADAYAALAGSGRRFDVEYRRRHPDGGWVWMHARALGVRIEAGIELVDGMSSDVTERRQLEDQIRQAQKLEAIGQLSGGVAHDFNNILSVISCNTQFLLDDLAPNDPRRDDALQIAHAVERAVGLTRQLLAFSRRQVLEVSIASVDTLVGGIEKMLRRLIGEDIDLVVRRARDLGNVRVDVGQIEQVIMNLVVYELDALRTGGELTIETANVDLDELAASQAGCAPGPYVMCAVADTGCGMTPEIRERIFDPFFTTKGHGGGAGLGLSTVYGIVHQSGGAIMVESEPGRGSVFRVFLPRIDAAPVRAQRRTSLGVAPTGHETILLVEDDALVREGVARLLENAGYAVLSAGDPDEALAVAASRTEPVELVLSDVILPRASGPEIVARLEQRWPDLRALYMSGYSDHAILRDGALQDGLHFIQKPFSRAALTRKIREVLDA